MYKFVILKYPNSYFKFVLKSTNNASLIAGGPFDSYQACFDVVSKIRERSWDEACYHSYVADDGWHSFYIIGSDGKVLGESKRYKTKWRMNRTKDKVIEFGNTDVISQSNGRLRSNLPNGRK